MMKKIIILTLAFIFSASLSFAQFGGESYKEVTGKIKSKTKSQLVIVDDKSGEEMKLVVDPEATFYDAEFYPITWDKIKANERVIIRYNTTKEGVNNGTHFEIPHIR